MASSRSPMILSALLAVSCVPAVPLSRGEAARLSIAPPIPVLHVRSAPPWVDCPNDEGQKVWEYPGSASLDAGGGSFPMLLASGRALGPYVPAGGTWESIQDQWTESLQTPPIDPTSATATLFLSGARATQLPLPLAERAEEVRRLDPVELRGRFGDSPVMVLEAVRWVLIGCFFTYQPWFEVRATLFRPSTGEVLWRDTCGGTYPPGGSPVPASRDELEAGGRWLYRRIIEERAESCAKLLVASLAGAGPA